MISQYVLDCKDITGSKWLQFLIKESHSQIVENLNLG
jgi:hypothetical protein